MAPRTDDARSSAHPPRAVVGCRSLLTARRVILKDRVLDGPASGEKGSNGGKGSKGGNGSKGRNQTHPRIFEGAAPTLAGWVASRQANGSNAKSMASTSRPAREEEDDDDDAPIRPRVKRRRSSHASPLDPLQGYLAHKKPPHPSTLQ